MASPVRFTGGFTQAANYQGLGSMGQPNPFFYHTVYDDFDDIIAARYTVTANGTAGTAPAPIAGVNGLVQFVSGAVAGSGYTLTKPVASFQLTATTDAGKPPRTFFATSIAASLIGSASGVFGLINTSTNPIATTPTDGIWFALNAGVITLNYAVGGVVSTVTVPANAYNLVNGAFLDLTLFATNNGAIVGGVGANTMGYVPPQGTGLMPIPPLFPNVRLMPVAPFTTALLNPTIAVGTTTAAAQTVQIDYLLAAQER